MKLTIVPIIDHFTVFSKIPWNSAEKGKFHSLARNSASRGKLGSGHDVYSSCGRRKCPDGLLLVCLQAVCCSDKQHCCPSGYTCDVSAGTCSQHSLSMSWNALAVRQSIQPSSNDVVCPDKAECPDGDTCCQMTSGQYGCCPYPKVSCVCSLSVSWLLIYFADLWK